MRGVGIAMSMMLSALVIALACVQEPAGGKPIGQVISENGSKFGIEESLLWALREVESGGGADIHRDDYGSLIAEDWVVNMLRTTDLLKRYGYDIFSSRGDWQILFLTAYCIGFRGSPAELDHPETNCRWACVYLTMKIRRHKYLKNVIASFNNGSPRVVDGTYSNQRYVDMVYESYKRHGGRF